MPGDAPEVGAMLGLGPGHATDPVIIGGDGQGPGPKATVCLPQIARRGLGRDHWIEALVYGRTDVHVAAAGGWHELPDPGRAGGGAGTELVGGLDVREEDQVFRQPGGAECLAEATLVATADLNATAKALAQAALRTHPLVGPVNGADPAGGDQPVAQGGLVGAQGLPAGGLVLHAAQAPLPGRDTPADQGLLVGGVAVRVAAGKVDDLVDDIEVLVVMDGHLAAAPLGVDVAPEVHVPLDLRGNREDRAGRDAFILRCRCRALLRGAGAAGQQGQGEPGQDERVARARDYGLHWQFPRVSTGWLGVPQTGRWHDARNSGRRLVIVQPIQAKIMGRFRAFPDSVHRGWRNWVAFSMFEGPTRAALPGLRPSQAPSRADPGLGSGPGSGR